MRLIQLTGNGEYGTNLGFVDTSGDTVTFVLPGGASLEVVYVPPGTTTMGSPGGAGGSPRRPRTR